MPFDAVVPKIERVWSPNTVAEGKPLAGGTFQATVPSTVRFIPAASDPDPLDYTVELDLDVRDDQLVCTRLEVKSDPDRPGITTDALRRVPVGQYIRMVVLRDWFLVMEVVDPEDGDGFQPFIPPAADFAAGGMSDDVLREVARLYHWALATGDAPLGLLKREYGIPHGKSSRWVAVARRRGLIKVGTDGS